MRDRVRGRRGRSGGPRWKGLLRREVHLADVAVGRRVVFVRPDRRCGFVRRYLTNFGIFPGTELRVVSAPSAGNVIVAVEGARVALPSELTRVMIVE